MASPAASIDLISYTASIGSRIDGFFYRCANAPGYEMTWVSAGFEELTGVHGPTFIERRTPFSDLIHPDDLPQVDDAVGDALKTNSRWQIMYRLKTSRGNWRYVHETGGGAERDPETGEIRYLDGVILAAGHMTTLAEKLRTGQSAVKAMNGSVGEIFKTLGMLRMLSLNARIEAARAQEHGAGFSVVAQEMMNLAATGESVTRLIEAELGKLNDTIQL